MIVLYLLAFLIALAYHLNKRFFSFWTELQIKQLEPTFLVGNAKELMTMRSSIGEFIEKTYSEHKHERFIGTYLSYRPVLFINDPELAQHILISDFSVFHDRPTPDESAKNFPVMNHLFMLKGKKWRDLRVKLSPAFSSGKLKVMFPTMRDCSEKLQNFVAKRVESDATTVDIKDLCARFTMSNISSVAFGLENDCIGESNNIFYETFSGVFAPTIRNAITAILVFLTPGLYNKLKFPPLPKRIDDFITDLVKDTVDYREKNAIERNDFMKLLIELKNQGYLSADRSSTDENEESVVFTEEMQKLTMDELRAQVFIFFSAGFETSSSTMAFALFELARHQEIQRMAQEEIDRVMQGAENGKLTYELLNDMKFVDCCIDETLRKYPIGSWLIRENVSNYQIPDTSVVLPRGTSVFIPSIGFQRDPDIYDEPMAFKPQRFLNSPNGNPKMRGAVYLPFGMGNRSCVAARLGKLQSKLGVMMLLRKFSFELEDKELETRELKMHPQSVVLAPTEPVMITVRPR